MNLCDDLHSLRPAGHCASHTPTNWQSLMATLQKWVKSDVNPDWSKPALRRTFVFVQHRHNSSNVSATLQPAKDNSCFTCTLTLS